MGSWEGTCAVTRTPISYGDEILYILVKEKAYKDIYNLVNQLDSERRDKEIFAPFIDKFTGKDLDPNLREAINTLSNSLKEADVIEYICIGHYDDGGGVEEYSPEGYSLEKTILIHREAAEVLINEPLDETRLRDQLFDLVRKAQYGRIQLFGNYLLGGQFFDKGELEIHDRVLAITSKIIKDKYEALRKIEEDEDELLNLEDYMDLDELKNLE